MASPAPGIDFGTTNSTVGLCGTGGAPHLIRVEGAHRTIPSALFFSLEDGRTRFGREAVSDYVDGAEGRFMRALKSILGTGLMKDKTQVGRERVTFTEVIARFLRHLKEALERETGETAARTVLGRPVRFVDEDDGADREAQDQLEAAARSVGFAHVEFQFEPVAAALFHESRIRAERLALVVDIGGGTSDFTVVRLSPERARRADRADDILASSGVHVGGTDFDRMLNLASVQPLLGLGSQTADGKRHMPVWLFNDLATWHRVNLLYTGKVLRDVGDLRREAAEPDKLDRLAHVLRHRSGHRIAGAVEAAKIGLTEAEGAAIHASEPGLRLEALADRQQFEKATAELTARIARTVQVALAQAAIPASAVETVILTGGGAQVPAVLRAATAPFPWAEIVRSDAFGSVGLGLGLDAARRFR